MLIYAMVLKCATQLRRVMNRTLMTKRKNKLDISATINDAKQALEESVPLVRCCG